MGFTHRGVHTQRQDLYINAGGTHTWGSHTEAGGTHKWSSTNWIREELQKHQID